MGNRLHLKVERPAKHLKVKRPAKVRKPCFRASACDQNDGALLTPLWTGAFEGGFEGLIFNRRRHRRPVALVLAGHSEDA
jgi:hypothetical protein